MPSHGGADESIQTDLERLAQLTNLVTPGVDSTAKLAHGVHPPAQLLANGSPHRLERGGGAGR